jgi:hypothetical protein
VYFAATFHAIRGLCGISPGDFCAEWRLEGGAAQLTESAGRSGALETTLLGSCPTPWRGLGRPAVLAAF